MAKETLSIRLSADGLSFWLNKGDGKDIIDPVYYSISREARGVDEPVREAVGEYRGVLAARGKQLPAGKAVWADTLQALLVPHELFSEVDAERYMSLHGFGRGEDQYTVCSKEIGGAVAVMELPRAVMHALGESLGEFSVGHILQYNILHKPEGNPATYIGVHLSLSICHITAFRERLLVSAESYPYSSLADLRYYISAVMEGHGLDSTAPVYIRGERADENARLLSKSFNGTLCG